MGKMNLTLAGVTFTDFLKSDVGSSAFRLDHDYFTKQDLVIRTSAGGGTLLVEDVDYVLAGEDLYLSTQVTIVVGSGRNVVLTIQIINAAYETGALYFSGKYIADAVEASDVGRIGYVAKSANFTVRRDDGIRTFNITTGTGGAGDVTAALPVCDGTNGRIRFVKVDTGTNKAIIDADGTEKIGVEGVALTFELYIQGDYVELEDMETYWSIVEAAEGKWFKVADPTTGFFDQKTTAWTADRFTAATGGWELSFASLVPVGTERIRLTIAYGSSADGHLVFARKCGDTNISNTPNASSEWSHIIGSCINNISHYFQTELWLSSDYKVEFAVNHVDVNVYVAYVHQYFRRCRAV